jgi:nitroreductase
MDVYEAIKMRKSVRSYESRDVPDEVLTRILDAARLAPSANNFQEWRFVVVRDAQTRRKIARAACRQTFVGEAPVVLACCAKDSRHVMTCGQASYPIDAAIAIDHITLCAAAEGLGTCWIGAFYEDEVKQILGIPPNIRVVALMPLGYPRDPEPVRKLRLSLKRIVSYESWQLE